MVVYKIYDPVTGKLVQELEQAKHECYNEYCGGCSRCLLMQAEYYGYKIEVVEEDECSSN